MAHILQKMARSIQNHFRILWKLENLVKGLACPHTVATAAAADGDDDNDDCCGNGIA